MAHIPSGYEGRGLAPLPLLGMGKVRNTWGLPKHPGHLLPFATDRISIFDFVLPAWVEQKGAILTAMNVFWRQFFRENFAHDLVAFGAGIEARNFKVNLAGTKLVLDGSLNVWTAPDGVGVSAEAGAQTNVLGKLWKPLGKLYLGATATAKTDGYVMAQPLDAGVSGAATLSYIPDASE